MSLIMNIDSIYTFSTKVILLIFSSKILPFVIVIGINSTIITTILFLIIFLRKVTRKGKLLNQRYHVLQDMHLQLSLCSNTLGLTAAVCEYFKFDVILQMFQFVVSIIVITYDHLSQFLKLMSSTPLVKFVSNSIHFTLYSLYHIYLIYFTYLFLRIIVHIYTNQHIYFSQAFYITMFHSLEERLNIYYNAIYFNSLLTNIKTKLKITKYNIKNTHKNNPNLFHTRFTSCNLFIQEDESHLPTSVFTEPTFITQSFVQSAGKTTTKRGPKKATHSSRQKVKGRQLIPLTPAKLRVQNIEQEITRKCNSFAQYVVSTHTPFFIDNKTVLGTLPISEALYEWMLPLRVCDLNVILVSLLIHPEAKQEKNPYTAMRKRDIQEAQHSMFTSNEGFNKALVIISVYSPLCVPCILQDDSARYPLPLEYKFFEHRCVQLQPRDYGNYTYDVESGEPNFFHEFFSQSHSVYNYKKLVGVIKTIIKTNNGVWSQTTPEGVIGIQSDLRVLFKPLKYCLQVRVHKKEIEVTYLSRLWFLSFLPREIFYIHHKDGDHVLYHVLEDRLDSIRDQIVAFAKEYCNVGKMIPEQFSALKQARINVFKKILSSPEMQLQFLSGRPKQDICNEVYRNNRNLFLSTSIKDNHLESMKQLNEKKRYKRISNTRKGKNDFIADFYDDSENLLFQPQSLKYVEYTVTFTSILLGVIALGISYFIFEFQKKQKEINDFSRVARTTLASWSLDRFLKLDRIENKENIILALEIKTILHMIYEYKYGSKDDIIKWASNFALTRGQQFVTALTTVCTSFYPPSSIGEFQPESKNLIDAFGQLAGFISSNTGIKLSPEDIRQANNEFTYLNNIKRATSEKTAMACNVISLLCRTLFSFDPFDIEFQNFSTKVLEFCGRVSSWEQNPPKTHAEMAQVVTYYDECKELTTNPSMKHIPSYMSNVLFKKMSVFEQLAAEARNVLIGDMRRPEPVCILFTGIPDGGKTRGVSLLKEMIQDAEYNGKAENYTTTNTSTFFEGYRNQPFVTMDEFFSSTEIEDRLAQAQVLLNMVNSCSYNLDMAFAQKGKAFFNSNYIFLTSNILRPDEKIICGLSDPNALARRFSIHVDVDKVIGNLPIEQNKYRVVSCPAFPQYVGSWFNCGQIANLARKIRKLNVDRYEQTSNMSKESYDLNREDYQLPNINFNNNLEIDSDGEVEYKFDPESKVKPSMPEIYDKDFHFEPSYNKPASEVDSDHVISPHVSPKNGNKKKRVPGVDYDSGFDPVQIALAEHYVELGLPEVTANFPPYKRMPPESKKDEEPWFNIYRTVQAADRCVYNTYLELWSNFVSREKVELFAGITHDTMKVLSILFIVLTTAHVALSFFKEEQSNDEETFQHQSHDDRKRKIKKKWGNYVARNSRASMAHRNFTVRDFTSNSDVQEQISPLVNLQNAVVELVFRYTIDGKNYTSSAVGTHLKDNWYAVPGHWICDSIGYENDNPILEVETIVSKYIVPFPTRDNIILPGHLDLAIIQLGRLGATPKAMYNHLPSIKDLDRLQIGPGTQLMGLPSRMQEPKEFLKCEGDNYIGYKYTCGNQETIDFLIHSPITYTGSTAKGDSGIPICAQQQDGKVLIVGMHCGVNPRKHYAVAVPLYKEYVDNVIDFRPQSNVFPLNVEAIVKDRVTVPKQSKFRRTKLYKYKDLDVCEENATLTYIPAHLSPFIFNGEIKDPADKALRKFSQVPFMVENIDEYEPELLDYYHSIYSRVGYDHYKIVLDKYQALQGVPHLKLPSIEATTSPGYPFCLKSTKGKAPYVVTIDNVHQYSSEAEQLIDDYHEKLKNDELHDVIWADMLKDETRPIDKVNEGKTRLFSTCPLDYLILGRMYFGGFVAYVQSLASMCPISVGINPHSHDWKMLYKKFDRFGATNCSLLAGDFSNYDGKAPSDIGKIFVKYINEWYNDGPDNARIRERIMEKLYISTHLFEQYLYIVCGGTPSGHFLTGIYNSGIQMGMWYIVLTKDFNLTRKQFELVVYGDDNIVGVEIPNLRCVDVAPCFKKRFDMEYTHFTKLDNEDHDDITTIRYLGRKFVQGPAGVILAPLELSVILESIYWKKTKAITEPELILMMFVNIAMELSHHSREVFRKELNILHAAVQDVYGEGLSNLAYESTFGYSHYHQIHYFGKTSPSSTEFLDSEESHDTRSITFGLLIPQSNLNVENTDNTDFTTRGANELSPTQTVELGHYADAAPVHSSTANSVIMQTPYRSLNLERFSLTDVLNREYNVATFSWTSALAPNGALGSLDFPSVLFSQSFIADKIKNFRYFRGGIRLSVRLSSTVFNYGTLIAFYTPDNTEDVYSSARQSSISKATGFPHILCSASSSDNVVFDIPFIYNRRALDLTETNTKTMGTVVFRVVNSLTNINASVVTVPVFVTAQFIDAEMYMPFKPQSKKTESQVKSSVGSISGALQSSATIASSITRVPIVGEYASLYATAANAASSLTKMMGLDKPTSLSRTAISKMNIYSDLAPGRGIDTSVKLAIDPENSISTIPDVAGVSTDELSINYIAGTPTLIGTATIGEATSSAPIELFTTDLDTLGSVGSFMYAQFIMDFFSYWSGTYKLKFYIAASNMHAVRLVFYINTSTNTSAWQDCYHRIVDVQGDTQVSMCIPYTAAHVITEKPLVPTKLYVKVLSYSQATPGVNTPIYINTYAAMGSDFRVYAPKDPLLVTTFVPQSNPRLDFQQDFDFFHESMTGYETKGYVIGEEILTMRDYLHRYSPTQRIGSAEPATYPRKIYCATGNLGPAGFTGLEALGLIFRFWRGSIRFKLLQNDVTPRAVYFEDPARIYGGLTASSAVNPILEFEIPYYAKVLFRSTGVDPPIDYQCTDCTGAPVFETKAAGDDFSFHFLCPPPAYEVPVAQPSYTLPGVIGFFGF